ncbi:MAG: hypothetical protein JEZ10_00700 [Verrucomicrobia bacterium]|nr:hypothetical protein [Verrucomicrobiota bacterium]
MNALLKNLIEQYTRLELDVQELVNAQCNELCVQCGICCCTAIICEEAIESPFLKLVHQQSNLFNDRYGFLTEKGCLLDAGRPPVCYEFFCADQLFHQPDELHGKLLRILGALPNHAGKQALGDIHLVDIRNENDFERLNFQGLEKQLQESFQCLEILRGFFNEKTLPEDAGRVFDRISVSTDD